MRTKVVFWLFSAIFLLDFIYGGTIFAITGDYWTNHHPIPIIALEGAGFTKGISLLILVPYFAAAHYLFEERKNLPNKYKKIFVSIIIIILALYAGGLIHNAINNQINLRSREKGRKEQLSIEEQFQKDVSIKIQSIEEIPQNYRLYKTNFIMNIPKEYFGDANGTIAIHVGDQKELYFVDTSYQYSNLRITDMNYRNAVMQDSKIVPEFTTNGDLLLNITYFIDQTNAEKNQNPSVDISIEINPERSHILNTSYYDIEYRNTITFN